ncbi:B3/4 domain-containing protein [Nanoarchaeota archaeon]
MKFIIDKQILEKFPDLNIGVVVARDIDNTGEDEQIQKLLREVETLVKETFVPEDVTGHPTISSWRSAYSSFGAKPKKYHSSIEALTRRILSGETLPKINKLVDLYNYISLKHTLPIGGDDIDKVTGNIHLTIAKGDELFKAIGSDETKNPKPDEVIYKDDNNDVLCRRWNWRECDKTKMTAETKNAVLMIEGIPPMTKEKIVEVANDFSESIKTFLKGNTTTFILNKDNPEVEL